MEQQTSTLERGTSTRLSSGIAGLDEIIKGGFLPGRAYLVRGGPGTGKTILGMHFLSAGVAAGDKPLFITLDESEDRVRQDAAAVGIGLKDVAFLDLSPTSEFFSKAQSYDIFTPAEVEVEPTTQRIVEQIQTLQPRRIFLEALTQFRYLSPDVFQFHKQVVSFLRFLVDRGATVLFTSEAGAGAPDDDLQFVSDGILQLERSQTTRTLSVLKFRGSDFQPGKHSMRLTGQGMEVFPRLVPERFRRRFRAETIPSGIPALDEKLSGGLERGTVTILTGPSGVGKTSVGVQFMKEAAGRGEHSVLYLFEEERETLVHRCEAINIPVSSMIDRGTLTVEQIEPLLYSPDEFARRVRREVEDQNARIVMIDSLAGYRLCIHQGEDMTPHIHALVKYLKNMGVTTLLVNEVEAITGRFQATELGISYLADNIVFMRYLEIEGELRKAIGVLKKRLSDFRKGMRELAITRYGIRVGEPLSGLRGILSGTPEVVGRLPKRNWEHYEPPPPSGSEETSNGRARRPRRRRQ